MDLAGLTTAIVKRLRDDHGAGGLFAPSAELITGLYVNRNPLNPGASFPYLQLNVAGASNVDAMRTGVREITFRVNAFLRSGPVYEEATDAKGWAILNRVKGDWEAQAAGTGPTYGLDRWQPTLTGDWTADICEQIDSITQHEDDALHFVDTYRVFLSRQGA